MNTRGSRPPRALTWTLKADADNWAPKQARRLVDDVWRCTQRGLVYPSPYAALVTFFGQSDAKAAITKARLGQVLADLRGEIHRSFSKAHTTAIMGVGFERWRDMSQTDGTALPVGMA